MRSPIALLALAAPAAALTALASSARGEAGAGANPIRKVVTLLQRMQKKVQAESKIEQDLYDKFVCYCRHGSADLGSSITTAEAKVPNVESSIQQMEAEKVQLQQDLKDHTVGRDEAKDAIAKTTAIREREAAAYAKESGDFKVNIAALKSAIESLTKGMAGGFLQTSSAATVRKLALSGPSMSDADRQTLLAFLSMRHGAGYMPQSGEIQGILKQLQDDMEKSLADITADEDSAISQHGELMAAKRKEVLALTAAIEVKSKRVGELAVEIISAKHDLEDTQQAMAADQAFLADLSKNCDTKAKEWEERTQTRAEELATLAETIKVLNDDASLDIFKKTLPATGFLQVGVNTEAARAKALEAVGRALGRRRAEAGVAPELDLIALALRGKQVGFGKVIKMIDDLVVLLKKEQVEDNAKLDYCNSQLDSSDDKRKETEQAISDHETAIADAEEGISKLKAEIKALEEGVRKLDKSVAEATEQRQKEHAEFSDLLASNAEAKKLLAWAKNRLAKFYSPKLYKAPAKRPLTEEERIEANMGSAESASVFAQVSAHARRAARAPPAPAPETFGAYARKTEESAGVVALIDLLVRDLDKEITEAEVEEKNGQEEYEQMMADSAAKRSTDAKAVISKQSTKADIEGVLQSHSEDKASATKELAAVSKFIASLHSECDWLVKYHSVRKEARASELDSLANAKAVLSGASFPSPP